MTKFNQLTQAEHMYVYDKKSLAEIGMQLGLSRRILFYWKKQYNWNKKRFDAEHNKDRFSEELLEFARKMMNKISADIENNQKNSTSGNLFINKYSQKHSACKTIYRFSAT